MKNEYVIENFSLNLSSSQKQKINFFKNFFKSYSKNIYIVGGFLRDQLLSKKSDDIDIEIYDISEETFFVLMEKLGAKELTKKFFVYNYEGIDISLPRIEIKSSEGYHGFTMEVTNDRFEAIQRRDFTCNALMYNIFQEKLYDFVDGVNDIENKILKVVNYEKFIEDDIRFLRGIRMMAKFGFIPEVKTKEILLSMSLESITKTKIDKELKKIFL